MLSKVRFAVLREYPVPCVPRALRVEKDRVVHRPVALGATVSVGPFPNNLVSEIFWTEEVVEQHLQIVARGRIAVKVERALFSKASVHFS